MNYVEKIREPRPTADGFAIADHERIVVVDVFWAFISWERRY